jgi:hypothetical protein
MLFDCYIARNI